MSLPSPVYEISFHHGHIYQLLTLPPVTIATLPERSGISSTLNSDSGTKNPSAVRSNIAILYYFLVNRYEVRLVNRYEVRIDKGNQLYIKRDLGQARRPKIAAGLLDAGICST